MQYLNIRIADLRHPNYIGSDPVDRATWLNLSAFCAERENGGVITGCREWKSRMWEQVCGVTRDEVMRPCALWEWRENDLAVWNYPIDKEGIVRRKREYGQRGGRASWEQRREAPSEPPANHMLQHKLERNGMEGKGKEEEGKGNSAPESSTGNGMLTVPDEAEIYEFARQWPGLPSAGIGPGIPEATVAAWWQHMVDREGAFPRDWRKSLCAWHRTNLARGRKTPVVAPGKREPWQARKEAEAIEAAIAEHEANPECTAYVGEENVTPEMEQDLLNLREKLAALTREACGV